MRISVIITTCNRPHWLQRALNSVRSQTTLPHEIIVINDGADHATRCYLNAQTDITIKHGQQRGISAARNLGLHIASGDWVAFLDDDDAWQPHKLKQQIIAIKQHPYHLWCHTGEAWYRGNRRVKQPRYLKSGGGWIYNRCLTRCAVSPSSVMIDRAWLTDIGGFDERLPACEDYALWLRLSQRQPIVYIDAPLTLKYADHGPQLSRQYRAMDAWRVFALLHMLWHEALSEAEWRDTRMMLKQKLHLLKKGAQKYKRNHYVQTYQILIDHLAGQSYYCHRFDGRGQTLDKITQLAAKALLSQPLGAVST